MRVTPLSAVYRGQALGCGVLGTSVMPIAWLRSDMPLGLFLCLVLFMALTWGPLMWVSSRGINRVGWEHAPLAADATVHVSDRRGHARGVVLSVLLTLMVGAVMVGTTRAWGTDAGWHFWPGFTLGTAVWGALALRGLRRWEHAHAHRVVIRPDAPKLSWRRTDTPYLVVPYAVTPQESAGT